jgi:hypothetical protein
MCSQQRFHNAKACDSFHQVDVSTVFSFSGRVSEYLRLDIVGGGTFDLTPFMARKLRDDLTQKLDKLQRFASIHADE